VSQSSHRVVGRLRHGEQRLVTVVCDERHVRASELRVVNLLREEAACDNQRSVTHDNKPTVGGKRFVARTAAV
jgi:hypothetical protein